MDPRAKIPAVALLGLQFTTACEPDDPIVGVWSAVEIGGAPYPREEVDGEYAYRSEVELRVDEDLAGQYVQRDEQEMPGLDAYYEESRDITVIPGEGAKYRIEVASPGYGGYDPGFPAPGRDLDCVLEASELRCTRAELPSFESRWRKE